MNDAVTDEIINDNSSTPPDDDGRPAPKRKRASPGTKKSKTPEAAAYDTPPESSVEKKKRAGGGVRVKKQDAAAEMPAKDSPSPDEESKTAKKPARAGKKAATSGKSGSGRGKSAGKKSPPPDAEQAPSQEAPAQKTEVSFQPETAEDVAGSPDSQTPAAQDSLSAGGDWTAAPAEPPTGISSEDAQNTPLSEIASESEAATRTAEETSDIQNPLLAKEDETLTSAGRKRKRSRRGGRNRKKNLRPTFENVEEGAAREPASPDADSEETAPEPAAAAKTDETGDDLEVPETSTAATVDPERGEDKKRAGRKMYVSVLPGEQVEVVITEYGQVQEYYVEMLHQAKTKGNIYKGVISNVDQNLQAAFVSYGTQKNGFLQIDEIHPEYYVSPHEAGKGKKYPAIQKVLKAGQEMLVQVVKEPSGNKGAFLTTYLSLPGRFLVLTPGREQIGVSRKVEDEGERTRLRGLLEGLNPGPGLGVIVRTVSMGASKTSLQRDLQFLKRTWKEVRTRGTTEMAPVMVYQEMDLTARAVRDYLNESIGEIRIDDEITAAAVTEVAEALFPRRKNLVRVYKDNGTSLFERYNIQRQLDQIHSREVTLPSGGRLVIDPTEALTAIDINSGRSGGKSNFEDLAFRTNMEASQMIPLQLRLRDIGGQIVADFIEMRDKHHWREVEKTLRNAMKVDRARYDVGRISSFGLLEIVRQRLGSSAISVSTEPCPCCKGSGLRRNMEWQSQHALRDIQRLLRNAQSKSEKNAEFAAEQELALHLLNNKRQRLAEMEKEFDITLEIKIKNAQTCA
ncbi:MAG: Rne/Rng family ribonuclease [Desulfovibrio sp.]|jgi:ribonuclease E|nr:Rne/Rng family ribonuclease [Desulfovibrio sp.]